MLMHGGLLCIAFRLLLDQKSLDQKSLDNNSYLDKYGTYGHEIWCGHAPGCHLGRP